MRICIAKLKIDIDWWLDWLIGQMIDRSVANPILMHFGQHEQHSCNQLQSAGSAAAAATVTRVQQQQKQQQQEQPLIRSPRASCFTAASQLLWPQKRWKKAVTSKWRANKSPYTMWPGLAWSALLWARILAESGAQWLSAAGVGEQTLGGSLCWADNKAYEIESWHNEGQRANDRACRADLAITSDYTATTTTTTTASATAATSAANATTTRTTTTT